MLQHLKERRQDETGFTLIELMVVVLIMGILMAIAIPTFLSTQGSANDASAKSNATNAYTGEKAYYEDNLAFIDASTTHDRGHPRQRPALGRRRRGHGQGHCHRPGTVPTPTSS